MLVLGIETSCDETSAAVVENGRRVLSNVVLSSLHLHKPFGGVVPEIACRHHAELIDSVIKQAFDKSGCAISEIGLIGVTDNPGLIGALMVGISAAKGIALSHGIKYTGVNHLHAHLYAPIIDNPKIKFPFIGLVVSGGHTNLMLVKGFKDYHNLGQTTDDAVGEAFDKVAKILNLGYPGGPAIEKMAKTGNPQKIKFPRTMLSAGSLDFSFSGIKTSVLNYVQKRKAQSVKRKVNDICASFQEAVVDVIVEKSVRACENKKINTLVVGGGVSINSRLRGKLQEACKISRINIYFPSRGLCMDNAAMVAGLAYQQHK
ncbi:MAG: tRNA (adenosine(37)-N6)-threonylcarbamoyltransferase complex transferase subunit TsaD [Candidatus Omnitrophica bacterium CG12_big_fil_rev_8_21_14_0_65_43_15]|uniref:tRNA N6-adenosine threonylcarbamoyltransferase n=1 Tax=Candidatus Taenaricola geysiri TaxID=1974752 RepID=A0A2J0LEK6_9BACT|nr:MAG: tRNA (adenosine(37)-N6)-threonylcarbamoyltransferase complex transferase subunit TsaD [Candidatus Omnitrophica bacterium CG1_02_43_210]PIV11913.1 MAG: tRNA (adenosine(37)-N6)-threonylcarbamoyltransferase complex transferase subunit TsaD [Candidatus Omnitrophica bacterium CG03_land_8_20_14_0_80_43_22]PIW66295.1 MAG: tRNA (adenosine(37)-N6)-threonylcarbamoyltransferase complex transferase subunit TsaD [Candidatus Omnitrophica bacterium CG12_big_fil_rev_8_21_14_0_65_43_15]PIW79729.1 MAG: tR